INIAIDNQTTIARSDRFTRTVSHQPPAVRVLWFAKGPRGFSTHLTQRAREGQPKKRIVSAGPVLQKSPRCASIKEFSNLSCALVLRWLGHHLREPKMRLRQPFGNF